MRHPFRAVLAVLALAALPALAQDTYKIDPVHSEISFKIRHLLAKTSGRFAKFGGTIKVLRCRCFQWVGGSSGVSAAASANRSLAQAPRSISLHFSQQKGRNGLLL